MYTHVFKHLQLCLHIIEFADEAQAPGGAKWGEMGGHVPGVASVPSSMPAGSAPGSVGPPPSNSDMPWYLPQQGIGNHPNEHQQGMGGWPQSDPTGQAQQQSDPNTMGSNAQVRIIFSSFFFGKQFILTDASRSIEIRIGEGLPGHFLSESEPSSTRPRLCTNQYASIQDSSARICTSRTQTIGLSVVCRIVILIEAIADRQCSPRGRDGRPQPAAMDE